MARMNSGRAIGVAVAVTLIFGGARPSVAEPVRTLKVTVLSTMLAGDVGVGEWGFAALLEADGQRLLIDTGDRPETVLHNAEELGIDLSAVTDVVLTHNHHDHTGGLVVSTPRVGRRTACCRIGPPTRRSAGRFSRAPLRSLSSRASG